MTPRFTLSGHARLRCEQMGISPLVALEIVHAPSCSYPGIPGRGDRTVHRSTAHPEYLVVVEHHPGRPDSIVTVLLRSDDNITREEANARARARLNERKQA